MPWWFFKRKRTATQERQSEAAAAASRSGWVQEVVLPRPADADQRRYLENQPYLLPKDLKEVNRLDFQHYVLRALLKGNYLAPIENPRQILDVGCGTGQWAYEMARKYPQALVVGLDLEQAKNPSSPPDNYRFVQGDVLQGLPFADNTFDFVHQRLLFLAVPLMAWPALVKELVRVTAPGGWVELLETTTVVAPVGPVNRRLKSLTDQLAALRGLDTQGMVIESLDRYLREAGLIRVERRFFEAPLGEWGGRIGALLALDIREVWNSLSGAVAGRFQIPQEELPALTEAMVREWEEYRTQMRFAVAYGQKAA
jgi:ubiquinone/menaquinone biosynthesis C-methylase UbiE